MLTPSEWLPPQFINFLVQQRIDNINEQAVLAMKRARKAKASAAVHKRAQRSARAKATLISGERQDAYVRELVIPGTPVRACKALEQAATQARAQVTHAMSSTMDSPTRANLAANPVTACPQETSRIRMCSMRVEGLLVVGLGTD